MDDIFEKIKSNWELAVLACSVIAVALILGTHFFLGNYNSLEELSASGRIES